MNDHDECIKAIHKFHEDIIKEYMEKPNQKLDKSIRELTDEEFFLLSMLVLFDIEGDVISRQATIKYLCTNMNWHDEDGEIADDEEKLNAITDLINGVPPVTQQPKDNIKGFCEIAGNLTNGDVIKTIFPNIDDCFSNVIDLNLWWKSTYKGVKE